MTRPRLGVPVTYQFSVRYLLHTGLLARLSEVLDPVVLLDWDDPALVAELEAAGAEVRRLPRGTVGPRYAAHRRRVEALFRRRLASPTTAIDHRRSDLPYPPALRLRRRARRMAVAVPSRLPGGAARTLADEEALLRTDTDLVEVAAALAPLALDAVCSVTPYHHQEELFLRAAARTGMPMVASIISFDNPTTRSWVPVTFDRYLVWNRHNRVELVRSYPDVDEGRVTVTGAPQLDFYADPAWCWDGGTWRERLGLGDGPVVLFGGGPSLIVPNEPQYLAHLDAAVSAGLLPDGTTVLFRRHPMETLERWTPTLAACRHVVVDEPWAVGATGRVETSSATREGIERLVSTLAHADVHVSTSSTMTVDGAWFDRPQVGPAYDEHGSGAERRQVRDLYRREHWLPIAASGGMVVAPDRPALVGAVADGLADPAAGAKGRRRLLEEIVTHTDGRSTQRVAEAIADVLGVPPPESGPPGAPHPGSS